ncbi:MAG: FAD-dependent oxidoreductase [Chloroflexota bacterium]|nr:FAD-dependent oxidoreductase [Chloroflexota bacterium]MDE2899159.1 FAD-dependent oxidoreductase [Chloroflexota bacterium]
MKEAFDHLQADVVVAGSGIGGLTAARTALAEGASVLVIEKAPETGGSAAVSGGSAWTAATVEAWLSVQPGGDRAMGQALVANYLDGVAWFELLGLRVEERPDATPYKFARYVHDFLPDARTFMDDLAASVEAAGGTILTNTGLRSIRIGRDGGVAGVEARGGGRTAEISAGAVVLATGGFQASPDLRARYFGRWAHHVIVRGNAYSTGDGFLAAQEAGAGTAGPFGRFYGHMIPAPPAETGLHNFASVKPDFSPYSVFVNLHGQRFDDEFLGDEVTVHAVVHQPEALCFIIFDERVRKLRATGMGESPGAVDRRMENIRNAGGDILEAEDLEALAAEMARRWGVSPGPLMATLREHNAAAAADDLTMLSVPRGGGLQPLDSPPFRAIRCLPGATFTYGGARANERAQILDLAGQPIPGLFAAGADVGGLYTRGYTGGLCVGVAYGRIAGREAAALIRRE